ncbi:hypothetical protein FWF48_00695 [Candidatus Saccharibacteria bacterium]|nr:hypothetical protein [Candidatus Saccharibacteria bacterium]
MKRQKKRTKKWLIIIIITLLVAGIVAYFVVPGANNLWPWYQKPNTSKDQTTKKDKTNSQSNSEPASNPAEDKNVNLTPSPDNSNTYVSNPTDSTKVVVPFITRANTQEVLAIFNSAAAGQCQLTLSKAGAQNIVLTVNVIWQNQYLCSFNLSNQTLTGDGWSAKVINVVGSQTSTPVTAPIDKT